jgi:hypothetical protein
VTPLTALALLFAVQTPAPGTTETVYRARPVTETEAAEEFGRTCVAGWGSLERLEAALRTSRWPYRKLPDTMDGLRSNWQVEIGELAYIRPVPGRPELPLPQCNMTAFARVAVNDEALRDAIGAMLSRRLGRAPQVAMGERSVRWSWDQAGRRIELRRIRLGPQQIELSLQDLGARP